jgi:hypothetical protein
VPSFARPSYRRRTVVKHEAMAIRSSRLRLLGGGDEALDAREAVEVPGPSERATDRERAHRALAALATLKRDEAARWCCRPPAAPTPRSRPRRGGATRRSTARSPRAGRVPHAGVRARGGRRMRPPRPAAPRLGPRPSAGRRHPGPTRPPARRVPGATGGAPLDVVDAQRTSAGQPRACTVGSVTPMCEKVTVPSTGKAL